MKGNLSCTCLKKATLLTELNALVRSRETSTQSGMVTQRFNAMRYVLSTTCHTALQTTQGECARELLFEVAHDGRTDKLVEDGPMAMGLMPPSFLAMGISLAPKKSGLKCSGMNRWLAAIHLHSLQMALTASEFICCLMMSALYPSASAILFSFAFLGQTT